MSTQQHPPRPAPPSRTPLWLYAVQVLGSLYVAVFLSWRAALAGAGVWLILWALWRGRSPVRGVAELIGYVVAMAWLAVEWSMRR